MWVSKYLLWFVVYSVAGWVYESTYCTIMERKWENRGFLYGPLCPIYGSGVIAMMAAWQVVQREGLAVAPWQVFVATAVGSAVLEYATSYVLEKLFHARWWDYSQMPLNLNGRICLPATVLFGLMGLLVVYVLYQPTLHLTDDLTPELIEAIALLLMGLVSVDTTLTVSSLTQFAQVAQSVTDSVNKHMDEFVNGAVERTTLAGDAMARERERFAAAARASRLGELGLAARSAASRIRVFTEAEEELETLRAELRK